MVYETAVVCVGRVEYLPAQVCGIPFLHSIRRFSQGKASFGISHG
jgi:hypothetical protein